MAEGLELIDQRPAGNTCAILFDSMYAANVVEGNWTARTNRDAASRTAALLEEVRRRNDVHLIHVKGHSVHEYPGNDIADELAWWGKEGPPFCRLRPGGGDGASRNGPAANYEASTERRAEEKAAAARAALLLEIMWRPHEWPLRWEALRMRRKGVLAEPPSERPLRLTWRA
jgi:hypothetical protein